MKSHTIPSLVGAGNQLQIRFPDAEAGLDQDAEWCEVMLEGDWKRFRFHDYDQIYNVPGLYECLFYRTLKCTSPVRVTGILGEVLEDEYTRPEELRVLDVGAGNGMVGSELQNLGVDVVVGVDIIPEAESATERDRPWAYTDYLTADLTALTPEQEKRLKDHKLNCMVCVAALGFGDMPRDAFLKAIDLVATPGWVAFNIKEEFMQDKDDSGFADLIRELGREDIIQIQATRRYRHRLSSEGKPLYYAVIIARKLNDVPASMYEKK